MTKGGLTVNAQTKRPWRRALLSGAMLLAACAGLLSYPDACAAGVQTGLSLCATLVLPALFPFLTVSSFLLGSGLLQLFGRLMHRAARHGFYLPGESAGVVLMALVGGFPVGASMTAQLYAEKRLTAPQAKRMCLFCMAPGPAFVLSAVGEGVYRSLRVGVLLYASVCLAALISGVLLGCGARLCGEAAPERQNVRGVVRLCSPLRALDAAVKSAAQAMVQICAWVVLFSAVAACIGKLPLPAGAELFCSCFLEITTGVRDAAQVLPLPAVAALLSFGGFAVHCQVLPYLESCGVRLSAFFAARVGSAVLCAGFCAVLLRLFPCEVSAAAQTGEPLAAAYSVSVPAFVMLMLSAVLLILEVEPNRKVCYNTGENKRGGKRNVP